MEQKIVECVPNFSEGRDENKISEICSAIKSVPGVKLLGADMGFDTNRTVVTFIGNPEAVMEAAFKAVAKASEIIDMSKHKGEHPRLGATDVCPFVPVKGVTIEDCVDFAKKVGERVGNELNIPVYLYEAAATKLFRKNLANIRKGEYEGLKEKLKDPLWQPDFGPAEFNPKTGATCCGAREFLIAFNINLNTRDKNLANDIALELREKGRNARKKTSSPFYRDGELLIYGKDYYPCGECEFVASTFEAIREHCKEKHDYDLESLLMLNDLDSANLIGKPVKKRGKFSHCKAIGWYVEKYKRAQISINLTNFKITPPHIVLEEARKLAIERGIVVTGSEIVGLIPYQAILEAGKYYLNRQRKSIHIPPKDIIETAIFSMGLNDVTPFEINKKVLGLSEFNQSSLLNLSVRDFIDEVSRDTPAPGGGSVSALAGALAAALNSMVGNLTLSKKITEKLNSLTEKARQLISELSIAVDKDTEAFNSYLHAIRLPQNTKEETILRERKIDESLKEAISIPYGTAKLCLETMKVSEEICKCINGASLSDAAIALLLAFCGAKGGILNVLINLKNIKDETYKQRMKEKCSHLLHEANKIKKDIEDFVFEKMDFLFEK